MTTIALPTNFSVTNFSLEQFAAVRKNASLLGGTGQQIDLLQDRWYVSLSIAAKSYSNAAAIEAWIANLRNGANYVNIYHMVRPTPRGTVAQNGNAVGTNAIGSATLAVTGMTPAGTLLAGDMIQCNGLLLMVSTDITLNGSGAGTIALVNRLRVACSGGQAVTWNRPAVPFTVIGRPAMVYGADYAQPLQMEFMEVI